jgi:hypothetical protein
MSTKGTALGTMLRGWDNLLIAVAAGIFYLIFRDNLVAAGVAWVIATFFAFVWWYDVVRRVPRPPIGFAVRSLRTPILLPWIVLLGKCIVLLIITLITVGWGWLLWQAAQPYFEPQLGITALNTLDDDKNVYELTDQLIWNQDGLDEYGVGITFTLEIRPTYLGRQRFGKVIALIAGDEDDTIEKELWSDFDSESGTQQIHLTLSELLRASGLQLNSNPLTNPFRPGDPSFQQAKLIVQIARAADKANPWASEEITIRNAPWEQRSELVWRDEESEVDVYVRNLGGMGGFTVRYRLARLEKEIGSSALPEISGATTVTTWNEPGELKYLQKGEFFTDTVPLPDQLAQGRYLLEVYAVKKQNYIQFEDPNTTWRNLNSMNSPWWFGQYPYEKHIFVVTTPEFPIDATMQKEWERLRDEQGIDLGIPIKPVEEVTSATGTIGQRQVFQQGEISVHDGQAYALYGPILEHYKELGGAEYNKLGLPISPIQTVTSSSGAEGYMMEFEGPGSPHSSTLIYASRKGVAAMWMWIRWVYSADNGGHSGWLGFPLADEQYYTDSTIQMFEHGYIVYHYPYVEGERDWGRPPVAYPYLASRGTLFDVHAQQLWQDTGVPVQPGDRVTIVQVGGAWTHGGPSAYDANGYAGLALQAGAALPSALVGTLIARIGDDSGSVFSVGRWSVLTAPAAGTLYLAMNDNIYEDNAGFITVQIMVEHSD